MFNDSFYLTAWGVCMDFVRKSRYGIEDLLRIITILRAPDGCPWDREQTHESIRKNLIEETYEVADAIDLQDAHLLQEELGDLLLQVLLHTEMERENGVFDFEDVCDTLCQKLVHRHPHVFGDVQADSSGQVLRNWEALKNEEKGRNTAKERLASVPASLPALMRSEKLQKRAAEFGFCYPDVSAAMSDLESEVAELKQALQGNGNPADEVGDVLFAATNVSRMLDADAEEALTRSAGRFAARVTKVEELAEESGRKMSELDAHELDCFWRAAKKEEK